MNGGKRPFGYTIVEVMIVLAVSGVMFVVAANFINGKQSRTAFTQGVNELASRIQGIIEDVNDGHFSDVPFTCTAPAGTPAPVIATGDIQGTNSPCTFLGKMAHFSVGTDLDHYEVFSLAGSRLSSTGGIVTDPTTASVTVIDALTSQHTVPQSLEVTGMRVIDGGGASHVGNYGLGFLQGLGSVSVTDPTAYATGTHVIGMVYANGIAAGDSSPTAVGKINGNGRLRPARMVIICLSDGTRNAHITIGEDNNQLAVRPNIGERVSTACS